MAAYQNVNYESFDRNSLPTSQSGEDSSTDNSTERSMHNVRCPTCNGIGWVRKQEQGQLVALIPLNDQRLKPRRTLVYVILAVSICVLAGALLAFFLYPRDVTIESNLPALQPYKMVYGNLSLNFVLTNYFNLSNSNYYSIPVSAYSVSAMMSNVELSQASSSTNDTYEARSRSTLQLPIDMTFVLSKSDYPDLVARCENESPFVHILAMDFAITVDYSALGHSQEVSASFAQDVVCYPAQ